MLGSKGASPGSAREVWKEERKEANAFARLRKNVQFWPCEPKALRYGPMSKQEIESIPRPGTAVKYEEGTHQVQISETDRARLSETFAAFDSNSNGTISTGELEAMFIALDVDIDPDMLEVVMRDYDEDGSGEMSFDEFVPLFTEMVEALDLRARGMKDPTLIAMHQIVYACDSLGVFKEAKVREVIEIHAQALPVPKGVIDFEEPKAPKVERREYRVRFTGGEILRLPRRLVWTKEELNLPQSAVDIKDIIPPSKEVIPISFHDLSAKGVPAASMPSYIGFCHRHGSGVSEWYPVLKNMCYNTQWIDLEEADLTAFIEGDWGYLHSTLSDRISPMIESDTVDARSGLLPRISTCVPTDHATAGSCLLTKAWADANEADSDVREFVTKQRRNMPLPQHVAERHGFGDKNGEPVGEKSSRSGNNTSWHSMRSGGVQAEVGHIPTKKDVEAAQEKAAELRGFAIKLQKAVGRSRLLQFSRETKDRQEELKELQEEKQRLIREYEKFMEIEIEKLSLIDQMHSGPRQDELKDKSKKQLRYLESSLLDAKDVMSQRIQEVMERDDEVDEGAIAMESETEGIERMVVQSMSLMEKLLQREVSLRQEVIHKQAALSAKQSRRSRITVRERQLTQEETAEMASVITRAVRCFWTRREVNKAQDYWTEVRSNVKSLGPSPPLDKNIVLAAGLPLFGHYVGYSLTLETERGDIETRMISRWTEFREATVRVPFSARPLVGGRFALQPPGVLVTIIAQLYQAFMVIMQGKEDAGLDSSKLRKAMASLGVLLTDSQARKLIERHGQKDAGGMDEAEEIHVHQFGNVLRNPEFKHHVRASLAELHDSSGPKYSFLTSAIALIDEKEAIWDEIAQWSDQGWKQELVCVPEWHSEFLGREPQHTPPKCEGHAPGAGAAAPEQTARRTLLMAPGVSPGEQDAKRQLSKSPQLEMDVIGQDLSAVGEAMDIQGGDGHDDWEGMERAADLFTGSAFSRSKPGVSPVGSFVRKSLFSGGVHNPDESNSGRASSPRGRSSVRSLSSSGRRLDDAPVPSGSSRIPQAQNLSSPIASRSSYTSKATLPPSLGELKSKLAQENDFRRTHYGGGRRSDELSLDSHEEVQSKMIGKDALSPGPTSQGIRFGSVSVRPRSASYNSTLGITLKGEAPEQYLESQDDKTATVAGKDFGGAMSCSDDCDAGALGGFSPTLYQEHQDFPSVREPVKSTREPVDSTPLVVSGMSFGSGHNDGTPSKRSESPSLRQAVENSGKKLVDELRVSTPVRMFGSFLNRVSGGRSDSEDGRNPSKAIGRRDRRKGHFERAEGSGGGDEGRRQRRRTSLAMMGAAEGGAWGNGARDGHSEDQVEVRWAWFGVMENVEETQLVNTKPMTADFDLENLDEVRGKIAVCESGLCSLVVKARNAQNAGAVALVILCTEYEIDQEVYFNKPKPRMKPRAKEPHGETNVEESLDRLHASLRHKHVHTKAQQASAAKSVGAGDQAHSGPNKRRTMMGEDIAEVAAAEAAAGVPEYERRSMIRIPVVLALRNKAKGVKTGSKVTIHVYDEHEEIKLHVWPYQRATMGSADADVRSDWVCVTNVILRAFHTVQLASLPIGVRPEDPEAWSLDTLNESLRQMNWVPKKHREYTKKELAKLARDMKCKPPNAKTLQVFKVKLDEGQHLPMMDNTVKSSSFVTMELNKVKRRSKTVQSSQDPLWRESFKFQMTDEDVRHSLISNAKELFDKVSNDEQVLELEALEEMLKTLKVRESAKNIMSRFDMDKTGNIDWAEFVIMFDALGFDKRDLTLTLYDSAIAGIEQEVGKAVVSVKTLKSGETKSLTVMLEDSDGEVLYGHDGRATSIKIMLSMHNISSAKVFDKTEKEASRIIAGSDKILKHLEACRLLGGDYSLKLCVSKFDPSLPENPFREFRMFIHDHNVTAITQCVCEYGRGFLLRDHTTQRYGNIYFAELNDEETRKSMFMKLMNFFYLDVQHEMKDASYQNYVLDVYIVPPSISDDIVEHCKIIGVKPFHDSVDAVLFDWNNHADRSTLESGAILPYGVDQYIEMEDGQMVSNVEMRVRLEPLDDPLGSLATLWSSSLKELVNDLGLEDPSQDKEHLALGALDVIDQSSSLLNMSGASQTLKSTSAACSIS